MSCHRCASDPRPANFGSDRRCAFRDDGTFEPDNWSCATIDALLDDDHEFLNGDDESMQMIPKRGDAQSEGGWVETYGWIVLNRYKHRGRTDSAVWVGQFWPPRPLTLAIAETHLKLRRARRDVAPADDNKGTGRT